MRYLLLFFLSILLLHGNIDATIDAIKNAPAKERFKLMNAFKKQIVQMQKHQQIEVIRKLKSVTKSKHSDRALKEIHDKEKILHKRHKSSGKQNTEILESHIENQIDSQIEEGVENAIENQLEDEHDDD